MNRFRRKVDLGVPAEIAAEIALLRGQQVALARYNETALPSIGNEVERDIFRPMIDAVRHYPPRKKGMKMRWKNDRQRRKVMALLREDALMRQAAEQAANPGTKKNKRKKKQLDLAYVRTGALALGWVNRMMVDVRAMSITITTANEAVSRHSTKKYQRFVTGDIGKNIVQFTAPMQPFHVDRGWQPAQPMIALAHQQADIRAKILYNEGAAKILKRGAVAS